MAIMKRQLLISIESGNKCCGPCDGRLNDECVYFSRALTEDAEDIFFRCPECLESEGKAIDRAITAAKEAART